MVNDYSVDDLQQFLTHAADRGMIPAATAQALAVAVRNVFGVLPIEERTDIRKLDLESVIKRFTNKRAKDFSSASLKEYARRARRAVELYMQWLQNPADFTVKTRNTSPARKKERPNRDDAPPIGWDSDRPVTAPLPMGAGYQSAFPVRPGRVVTLLNVPEDLTAAEAERLAQFVRMLAVE